MLTLQAILLTSSLLMVMAMVGSLLFLATLRERLARGDIRLVSFADLS